MLSRRLLRIKTVKSLYCYFQSDEDSLIRTEKEMHTAIRKCYELYLLMLQLTVEVADLAGQRIEIAAAKQLPTHEDLNPNMRFVENRVVNLIRNSPRLSDLLTRHGASWGGFDGVIKRLYTDMIASPYYIKYMESPTNNFAADRRLVADFLSHHIEDNEDLEQGLEESSIFWIDDIEYALGAAIRTISSLEPTDTDLAIPEMYKNDDDRNYVLTLLRKSLVNHQEYFGYIDKFTENWDFDRIAFMDKIIMLAAITELTQFPSIPVKVTLDEFIEISKYYSTPGSNIFVNGILDKLVDYLTEKGTICKSGRGLIDTSVPRNSTATTEAYNEEIM